MGDETVLEMVRRHVVEGEAQVKRQYKLVTLLQEQEEEFSINPGLLDQAIILLDQFKEIQLLHKAHLARLEAI